MEAIHAPAAWGYLSELSEVNVGLIDTMVNNQHEDIEAKTYVAAENSSGKETVQEITTSMAAPGRSWYPRGGDHVRPGTRRASLV